MRFTTAKNTRDAMLKSGENWILPLMNFVDDFRRARDPELIRESFDPKDEHMDSILASTIESLCHETEIETPAWVLDISSCTEPWFVSGIENLKAICIAESPPYFRRRKIFVLENFLHRV